MCHSEQAAALLEQPVRLLAALHPEVSSWFVSVVRLLRMTTQPVTLALSEAEECVCCRDRLHAAFYLAKVKMEYTTDIEYVSAFTCFYY